MSGGLVLDLGNGELLHCPIMLGLEGGIVARLEQLLPSLAIR